MSRLSSVPRWMTFCPCNMIFAKALPKTIIQRNPVNYLLHLVTMMVHVQLGWPSLQAKFQRSRRWWWIWALWLEPDHLECQWQLRQCRSCQARLQKPQPVGGCAQHVRTITMPFEITAIGVEYQGPHASQLLDCGMGTGFACPAPTTTMQISSPATSVTELHRDTLEDTCWLKGNMSWLDIFRTIWQIQNWNQLYKHLFKIKDVDPDSRSNTCMPRLFVHQRFLDPR